MTWAYGSDRGAMAFIRNEAIPNLVIQQANVTTHGIVRCINQEDCAGLEIRMVRAGIADIPDRFETTTTTDENGIFHFKGIP